MSSNQEILPNNECPILPNKCPDVTFSHSQLIYPDIHPETCAKVIKLFVFHE